MRYRLRIAIGGTVLVLATLVAGTAGATAAPASSTPATGPAATPTSAPPVTCPPVIPLTGQVSAATTRSLTISYSIFLLGAPCGYDPPVTVTLFASADDARQWVRPVAEAVSGPERSGTVTIDGLTPGTAYWFRFTADGRHDPYFTGSGRTVALQACAATVSKDDAWGGGFVATITVRNTGTETLGGWRVSWRWRGDERIVSVWNGVLAGSGPDVTIGNASYNGTLPPDGSTTFGMLVAAGTPFGDLTPVCTA